MMKISFKKSHVEYLIYEMYKVSKNSRKLKYHYIFEVLYGEKRKELNPAKDENISDAYGDLQISDEKHHNSGSNNYEEVKDTTFDLMPNETDPEFVDNKKSKKGPEKGAVATGRHTETDRDNYAHDHTGNDTQHNFDTENNKYVTEQSSMNPDAQGEGENDDDYINDEEMIKIAENCLLRISDELAKQKKTIHGLFKEHIMIEVIEDQEIELLAPIHFIEGIKKLGINDFNELEIACLVNLLTRPELDDLILVEELNILKDNSKIHESVSEMLNKSQQSPYRDNEDEQLQQMSSNEKIKKRGMNFDKIGDRSVCVIFLLTEYLLRNNMSLFTLYDGKIYDQLVKTKTKESIVEIIHAKDFFDIIKSGIVSENYLNTIDDTKHLFEEGDAYQKVQDDLQGLLCLDQNYRDLLLIKKVTKFIDELTMSEELREQALRVLPDDIDFGDFDEDENAYDDNAPQNVAYNSKNKLLNNPMFTKGRNMGNNPYPQGGGERLNTIEEEEKQYETQSNIYKTNERKHNKSNSQLNQSRQKTATLSKGVLSETAAREYSDSRKRFDEDSNDNSAPRRVYSHNDSIDEDLQDNYPSSGDD